jgi:hypothetical protein
MLTWVGAEIPYFVHDLLVQLVDAYTPTTRRVNSVVPWALLLLLLLLLWSLALREEFRLRVFEKRC